MNPVSCEEVATQWDLWCGPTPWSYTLRKFGILGGKIIWFCGYPHSASAIPLCFGLIMPDNTEFIAPDLRHSRLKDIKQALAECERN